MLLGVGDANRLRVTARVDDTGLLRSELAQPPLRRAPKPLTNDPE